MKKQTWTVALVLGVMTLGGCGSGAGNETAIETEVASFPTEGREVLDYVSKQRWSGWGFDCSAKPEFRITYDARMGQMVFNDGAMISKSAGDDNVEFSYEFQNGGFVFYQKTFATLNLATGEKLEGEARPLLDETVETITLTSPDKIRLEKVTKKLDADTWEISGERNYTQEVKTSTETRCEAPAAEISAENGFARKVEKRKVRSFAPSFDCSKAASNVEKMICADKGLADLDVEMASTYKEALAYADDKAALKREQRLWLKELSKNCQDALCVSEEYKKRISGFYIGD